MVTIIGTIICAVITGGLSLVGVVFTSKSNNQKVLVEMQKQQTETKGEYEKSIAVTQTKLDELTREVRLHNGFAQKIPVMEEQIKNLTERVNNIEDK